MLCKVMHTLMHMYTQPHTHSCNTQICIYIYAHTQHYVCTQDGFFPLYVASQNSHDRIVKMLLQAGATVDLQDEVEDCYYFFICHLIVLCHAHYSL